MKRILLLGIVLIILGANGALAAVCPDIQFIKSFNVSQEGAEVPRLAAGADRKVYVADVNMSRLSIISKLNLSITGISPSTSSSKNSIPGICVALSTSGK
ncbi:hypothetical protein LCGC14_3140630, partial [marine sediment metagenome]